MCLDKLIDSVSYDAETGALTWRKRPEDDFASPSYARRWNARFAGRPAFASEHSAGYVHGAFGGVHYLAHRVAWACAHGDWPVEEIDHINGDRKDNRLANLREATRGQNVANNAAQKGHKSRFKGVTRTQNLSWGAYIQGKWLGTFGCETAAMMARAVGERRLYGDFARPNCGVA